MKQQQTKINFNDLLKRALTEPGSIMAAYGAFHDYSAGNQLIAYFECLGRGLKVGPISTFKGWESKGRRIRKGQKAISLYMPITGKRTVKVTEGLTEDDTGKDGDLKEVEVTQGFTMFKLVPRWFVLDQTEGPEVEPEPIPGWDEVKALKALDITLVEFNMPDGNIQGYASGRNIAINPLAQLRHKTLFHEMAHILLGHTDLSNHDSTLPRNIKEVEAESVAYLVLSALGLDGAEFCRGYIQSYAKDMGEIPETSAKRIFKAVDAILKAGGES